MRDYDVTLRDGRRERITAPGEQAATTAAEQLAGVPAERVEEVEPDGPAGPSGAPGPG